MPHADAASLPNTTKNKADLWDHIHEQLMYLLGGQRNWVTNLANAASLIHNSLLASPYFGTGDGMVNWCGFYIASPFFPTPRTFVPPTASVASDEGRKLLLGPFCGKPACQWIITTPGKARGVCADAFIQQKTLVVPDVDEYPGHIACDGETRSEIVCPLRTKDIPIGVLDLDCLAKGGFDEDDKRGLERITELLIGACDW